MAECSYEPPSTNNNPKNPVAVLGNTEATLKAYTAWSEYFCSSGSQFVAATANCHPVLQTNLDQWVNNMAYFASTFGGHNDVRWIGHFGAFVSNRTNDSYHRTGEAIDLAWVKFPKKISCRACNSPQVLERKARHRRYLAVEASLRKYFGYVLSYKIPNHDNHFHVDNGCPIAMNVEYLSTSWPYRSTAYFLQDCCNMFNNAGIEHDGIWGDQSVAAFADLLDAIGLSCLNLDSSVADYRIFLDYIQMHGFKNKKAGYYRFTWCDGQ